MTNEQRIEHARFALYSACWARGDTRNEGEDAVSDLLTDLKHYCAAHGLDYERCVRVAAMYYEAESSGGAA